MKTHYRQGDVLLLRVNRIPPEAQVIAKRNLVLAEGEVTGHAHRIVDDGAVLLTTAEAATFVRLAKKSQLIHEEHATVTLPPGDYMVVRQREYSPQAIHRVSD